MDKVVYKGRVKTNCVKWDGCEDKFGDGKLLPLWIADMDFEVPSCVKKAIKEYADMGVFGYYMPPKEHEDSFISWEEKYHGYKVEREWMRFAPGVVPAIHWLIHILTEKQDKIIIMPPVYYPFKDAVLHNQRRLVENPLVRTKQGYKIDFEDFEQKIIENDVKLFLFCSPHNPVGRVWTLEEIQRVMDICKKHHVYVISDEIHQDIVMQGYRHIVAASAGRYEDILIVLTAATKTFNLAACQNSILVIQDQELRNRYDEYMDALRIKGGNAFGYIAVQHAYEHGREWLEEILEIIEGNYRYMKKCLKEALPDVWIADLEGTYLMWIDLGKYIKPEEMEYVIQKKCGLAVDYGIWFGGSESSGFIRVNLATRRENIELAAQRLIQGLKG